MRDVIRVPHNAPVALRGHGTGVASDAPGPVISFALIRGLHAIGG